MDKKDKIMRMDKDIVLLYGQAWDSEKTIIVKKYLIHQNRQYMLSPSGMDMERYDKPDSGDAKKLWHYGNIELS